MLENILISIIWALSMLFCIYIGERVGFSKGQKDQLKKLIMIPAGSNIETTQPPLGNKYPIFIKIKKE